MHFLKPGTRVQESKVTKVTSTSIDDIWIETSHDPTEDSSDVEYCRDDPSSFSGQMNSPNSYMSNKDLQFNQ